MRVAVAAGADAVGFVTDVPIDTHREVKPDWAAALARTAPPMVTAVAVTMPETVEEAEALVDRVEPDAIQIHGDFSVEEVNDLRHRVRQDVIVGVDAGDTERIHALEGTADAILVDSTTEDGAGGTGETHDWTRVRDLVMEVSTPIVLAGGLTPDNVAEAVATADPFAVDVASGVELQDGNAAKDDEAIREFCREAGRGIDYDDGDVHPGGPA